MTLPTNASKANLDSATDDPKLARPDLADLVDKFNDLLTHLNLSTITSGPAAIPLSIANGGTSAATASAARTALGVEDATETAPGRIEIATQTEANNGTDDTRALTPAKLASISPPGAAIAAGDKLLFLDTSDSGKMKSQLVDAALVNFKSTIVTSLGSTTALIPFDDTAPQNTEGADPGLSVSIAPRSASNRLVIHVTAFVASDNGDITAALFQSGVSSAIAAGGVSSLNRTGTLMQVAFSHVMTAGTTSNTTFSVRYGQSAAGGTATLNGISSLSRRYGGVCASSITVSEITP